MCDVHKQDVLAVPQAWRTLSGAWKEFTTDIATYEKRQVEAMGYIHKDMALLLAMYLKKGFELQRNFDVFKNNPGRVIPRYGDVLAGFIHRGSEPLDLKLTYGQQTMHKLHLEPGVPTLALRDNCVSLLNMLWCELKLEGPVPDDLEVIYAFIDTSIRRGLIFGRWSAGGWCFCNECPCPLEGMRAEHVALLTRLPDVVGVSKKGSDEVNLD